MVSGFSFIDQLRDAGFDDSAITTAHAQLRTLASASGFNDINAVTPDMLQFLLLATQEIVDAGPGASLETVQRRISERQETYARSLETHADPNAVDPNANREAGADSDQERVTRPDDVNEGAKDGTDTTREALDAGTRDGTDPTSREALDADAKDGTDLLRPEDIDREPGEQQPQRNWLQRNVVDKVSLAKGDNVPKVTVNPTGKAAKFVNKGLNSTAGRSVEGVAGVVMVGDGVRRATAKDENGKRSIGRMFVGGVEAFAGGFLTYQAWRGNPLLTGYMNRTRGEQQSNARSS